MPNQDEIMTGQEAREFLKISRSTLWKLTKEDQIPAYRVGNGRTSDLRYKKSELLAWLNSNRVNSAESLS
jgi:excisionase family DNA binding protein